MSSVVQPPPAYPRLRSHPLASAFLAILWATLLVVGVQGWCALRAGDVAQPGEAERAPEAAVQVDAPTEAH